MSSFDYTDNFNGFNDLINRADFLTEMKTGKAHPSFKGLAGRIQDDPRSGGKGFPRDARMLIKTVLFNVDIFKDEDLATLRASGVEASRDYREALEALLDKYEDEIKDKASDIADELEKQFESFVNDQGLMVGAERKEMYLAKREAKAAADRIEKEIEGGGDVVDAVDDAVGELEQATADAFESLKASKEDPTTFIEIKIRDADRATDVSDIVTKYANEDGVEVSGDTVQFSVDPDTPLADAVSRHGIDKIEAALKRDVDKISDSVVIVMAPDADIEKAETESLFKDLPGADEDYEEGMYEMEGDDSYAANENEVQDEEYKGIKHKFSKEYRDKVDDEFKDHIKMRRRTPQGTSGVKLPPGPADDPDKYKDEIDKYLKQGYEIYNGDEEDNDLDHFLTKEQPEDYIPSTDYEDVLDDLVNKDKKEHAMKKLTSEDEEEFNYSPMLESHKTDTSAYLTEQAASDKRNKKTEVKNQSFTEKYKPKTHWQLEELRRYGL